MEVTAGVSRINRDSGSRQLLSGQLRLLYGNASLGTAVHIVAASMLCGLEWGFAPPIRILAWWFYIISVAGYRFTLTRRYLQASAPVPIRGDLDGQSRKPRDSRSLESWSRAFTIGVGLAGLGWGSAAFLLSPRTDLSHQVFLIFVLGGMMLGASSLLAPLSPAFYAFLVPVGLMPAIRLLLDGDGTHLNMGLLAGIFTVVTLITTRRMHLTILSSLRLQFENHDLVQELRNANQETAALNQALEQRVQERTAELHRSTEQLRTEIVQRQQAEEGLLRARKLESVGALAGGIAHDFNNLLTVVQGNIELAKAHRPDDPRAQGFLAQATGACQRARQLATQLLTFAKGGSPVRRLVSVAQLVTDAVQSAGTGSVVGFDVRIAENLWSAEVDPGQICQVFHNILMNARDAMPAGSAIEVRAKNVVVSKDKQDRDGARVRVSIRDHGSGIPPEVLRQIFDPFFATKPGTTGLELATAYSIVVKHGGNISVQSALGSGTEFTVDLPASTTLAPSQPESDPILGGSARLLVMDDDPSLRLLSKAVLNQLGYDVETAEDGSEALALYEEAKTVGVGFDVVLLDLTVPGGMGGEEAAARLKALDPAIRMVVSSAYSDSPVMSHYAQYGFDAVLEKPWTVQEMSDVLRSVLAANPVQQK